MTTVTAPANMNDTQARYRVPIIRIQMVRDGRHTVETKGVGSPRDAAAILRSYLEGADRENLVVLLMDTKNRVSGIHTVSIGDLSSAIVHPREVFKPAILANAAGIILCHNHPSGDPTPSAEDVAVTKRIASAGELLGVDLLDHIIIGDPGFVSLKERGHF